MTISSLLIGLTALTLLISMIAAIAISGDLADAIEEAYAGVEGAEGAAAGAVVGELLIVGFTLLLAIGLVVLAIFNNRGVNGTRIGTWIVGGILVCCNGISLLLTSVQDALTTDLPGEAGMPSPQEVQDIVNAHLPEWYSPLTLTLTVVGVLALLVALILLALPPSNEFFRRRPPEQSGQPPAYPQVG